MAVTKLEERLETRITPSMKLRLIGLSLAYKCSESEATRRALLAGILILEQQRDKGTVTL